MSSFEPERECCKPPSSKPAPKKRFQLEVRFTGEIPKGDSWYLLVLGMSRYSGGWRRHGRYRTLRASLAAETALRRTWWWIRDEGWESRITGPYG